VVIIQLFWFDLLEFWLKLLSFYFCSTVMLFAH
jgi:hypothetical protein